MEIKKDRYSKNIFSYKNILQKFSDILNNMDKKYLYELFPHLEFEIKGNNLEEIGQNFFSDFIESYSIDIKIYSVNQVASSI